MPERNSNNGTEKTITFRPHSGAVEIHTPEELVTNGIHISESVIQDTWGSDGVEKYNRAVRDAKAVAESQRLADGVKNDNPVSKMNA